MYFKDKFDDQQPDNHKILSDRHFFLNPGQLIVTSKDLPVVTILGSCVAITFFSPEKRTGAIFHAMLPEHRTKSNMINNSPPVSPDPDYVDYAFYYILEKFRQKGIDFKTARVMLFGGGDVIQSLSSGKKISVGIQNIKIAKKIIDNEGITLHGEDTGGKNGRKLIFLPHSGKVYLEYLKNETIEIPKNTSVDI
jgi:chemotaxis protein CheD